MTTNKPTTYWASSAVLAKLESRHNNAPCILTDTPAEFNDVALVRLSDYEALKAELARELQRRFDGNEQASREHREDMKALVEALEGIMRVEARDRVMPVGAEWDAARAALTAYRKGAKE